LPLNCLVSKQTWWPSNSKLKLMSKIVIHLSKERKKEEDWRALIGYPWDRSKCNLNSWTSSLKLRKTDARGFLFFFIMQLYVNKHNFWFNCWIVMRFFLEIPKVLFPIWLNFIVVEDWEDFSISPRNYVRDLLYFYSWFRIFFFIEFRIFFFQFY
jgi:hypothetical protein